METVVDLLIEDGDLVFDEAGEPVLVTGVAAIAQDIAHRVRESGTPELLVAEDDPTGVGPAKIADVVEEDLRVKPGSATVSAPDAAGRVKIRATLLDGSPVTPEL